MQQREQEKLEEFKILDYLKEKEVNRLLDFSFIKSNLPPLSLPPLSLPPLVSLLLS